MLLRILLALVFCVAISMAHAQLCQGSLGDPIVNITFGAGPNPGPPLAGATTNYQYYAPDCPDDGFYSVRNNSVNCFNSSWHSLSSDHTGNPNGYFMLVNSSFQPNAFYVDTVDLLCSNTTYEFAAWMLNMSRPTGCNGNPIQPNITFRIERLDGTIIQTYNTGNIPPQSSAQWRQYGFFFTTPSSVSRIILRLINNAPGGCGNDVALDDITFRPCGPFLNASIAGGASKDLCYGTASQLTFTVDASAYSSPFIQWQQSTNNGASWVDIAGANSTSYQRSFSGTEPVGTYLFRAAVAEMQNVAIPQCRVASGNIVVRVNANPSTTTTNNGPVCEGANASITATGGTMYAWNGPAGFSASSATVNIPGITMARAGKYYVVVTNDAGCTALDSSDLAVQERPQASVLQDSVNICKGDSIQLQASGGVAYTWKPATGLSSAAVSSPNASPNSSIRYQVIVQDQQGCTDSAIVTVAVHDKPTVNAGADVVIAEGQAIQLNGSIQGDADFIWMPPLYINNPASLQPVVNPPADIVYVLQATSRAGCGLSADSVRVQVFKQVVVPNAFSPNGDGINDKWIIPALQAYPGFDISVFDRYGRLVYSSSSSFSWDGSNNGKILPVGTYYYLIDLKHNLPVIKGSLLLIK
ncbi:gliding motility-associated C-terminal domain-containing protein [Aridibaculum aurantiacum]|uniref:gliding motility-associated C-terminal domain-containing protein n=1 Tax=Aridibaculum aurantiacum TaxID=2810307 RepID=UPI001A95FC2A|nr:gliding motility-associated C-terminal domain-containing protein [Aridibaculum aurantiacum]